MGEAKRRGTREEREAEARAYAEANRICEERYRACRARQRAQAFAALPPEKQKIVATRERNSSLSRRLAIALGAALIGRIDKR